MNEQEIRTRRDATARAYLIHKASTGDGEEQAAASKQLMAIRTSRRYPMAALSELDVVEEILMRIEQALSHDAVITTIGLLDEAESHRSIEAFVFRVDETKKILEAAREVLGWRKEELEGALKMSQADGR
jgi:hypothetical protein